MGLSDMFKKIFKGKSNDLPIIDGKFCINCSSLIKKTDIICNNCKHNQNIQIKKKITDVVSMVEAFFSTYYNQELVSKIVNQFNLLINEFEIRDDDKKVIEIQNELFIMDISVRYILILRHYLNNNKYNELKNNLDINIKQLLVDLWGQDNSNNLYQFLTKRVSQYQNAFNQDDPVKTIAKMVQFIIEKIAFFDSEQSYNETVNSDSLYMAADIFAMPLITNFMPCYIQVSGLIISYKTFLNRWELE
jgi:hypothetical protein